MTLQKKQEILRKHILCCEDDEILLRHLHDELEYAYPNSLIIICENGLQAIKQLEIVDFDLIISDYDMKVAGGDGLSLFEYTEKMGIETPFIIFSGVSGTANFTPPQKNS